MEKSIKEALDAFRTPRPKMPYYNKKGYKAQPVALSNGEAYWPQPIINDIPENRYVDLQHYE